MTTKYNNHAILICLVQLASIVNTRFLFPRESVLEGQRSYETKSNLLGKNVMYHESVENNYTHAIHDLEDPTSILNGSDLNTFMRQFKDGPKLDKVKKDSVHLQCRPQHPDFMKFIMMGTAKLMKEGDVVDHDKSWCFARTHMYYKWNNDKDLTVSIVTDKPAKSIFCTDTYLLSVGTQIQPHVITMHGVHDYTFKNLSTLDKDMLAAQGVNSFLMCDSISHLVPDILWTLGLFVGGLGMVKSPIVPFFGLQPWFYQEELNWEFVEEATGYKWKERKAPFPVNVLPKEKVNSGDYFVVTRFDGLDQIIEYGVGSHSGHSVVAAWDHEDGELYICESQDSWYWPHGKGLQRHKYDDWMKYAQDAKFSVVHLRLRPDLVSKFDHEAMWSWYKKVEGMPYGYRTFLFSWIDTVDGNYPPMLDIDFAYVVFQVLAHISPTVGNLMMGEALNHRQGTKDLSLAEIVVEGHKQGKTIRELIAEPEIDGVMYSDGQQMVCSCFVAAVWKAGGLFGDLEINAVEFTPRDTYQIKFWDVETPLDESCVKNDPDLPYCQFFGNRKIELPGFNSVEPYSHMNEHCGGLPPKFERFPQGC